MKTYHAQRQYQDVEVASSYDDVRFRSPIGRLNHWLDCRSLRHVLGLLPSNVEVLDVACGTGRITEYLLSQGHSVTGIDISQEMLQVARVRLKQFNVQLHVGEAERLPFPDDSFDIVFCVRFLGEVPASVRKIILEEMARVSRQYIVVQYALKTTLASLLVSVRSKLSGQPPGFQYLPTRDEAMMEFTTANLTAITMIPKLKGLLHSWMIVLSKSKPC